MGDFYVLFLWGRLNDGHLIVGSPEAWSTPSPHYHRSKKVPLPLLVDFCGSSFHTMASILDTVWFTDSDRNAIRCELLPTGDKCPHQNSHPPNQRHVCGVITSGNTCLRLPLWAVLKETVTDLFQIHSHHCYKLQIERLTVQVHKSEVLNKGCRFDSS